MRTLGTKIHIAPASCTEVEKQTGKRKPSRGISGKSCPTKTLSLVDCLYHFISMISVDPGSSARKIGKIMNRFITLNIFHLLGPLQYLEKQVYSVSHPSRTWNRESYKRRRLPLLGD